MKYVSLDLETTSLKPNPEHILMLSMVIEDTKDIKPLHDLEHFTCFVRRNEYKGEAYALQMNAWILKYIGDLNKIETPYPVFWEDVMLAKAVTFLRNNFGDKKITVAGKNVASFDLQFLHPRLQEMFSHKVLDVGPLFIDWERDESVPGLEKCLFRAGIEKPVAHDARQDALDVIQLLRTRYAPNCKNF